MLQLDPIAVANFLRAAVPAFVSVGLARDLATARRETIRWPSAWIVLLAETAGDNRYASDDMIEQPVTARIAVIMAVRDIADRAGRQASTDLQPLREAVMLSLGRFIPESADQSFRFSRGQRLSGVDAKGGMFWQDEFTLRFDRRIPLI
ncbi:hypothetical protein [Paracoccus sp. (in: a-proteobacteria)]|uniref:phage tail terminator protein n=1 Tax=Paracoccus sp. TaxID=267 RepID=UPI0028ADB15E|nr:hypothetical protein [Paracoccus sp. (in: a-proteobacteria)]